MQLHDVTDVSRYVSKKTPISWKLTVDFNEQLQLFHDHVDLDYKIVAFDCSCGHREFVIGNKYEEVDWICTECDNDKFYDANLAFKNFEYFLSTLYKEGTPDVSNTFPINYRYGIEYDDGTVSSFYYFDLPRQIDFVRNKILYTKKKIYSVDICREGELNETYNLRYDPKIFKILNENLNTFVNENPGLFGIPKIEKENLNINIAKFFMKHNHLREFEFYYWNDVENFNTENMTVERALRIVSANRPEKSVRRAVFNNYLQQIRDNKQYVHFFINLFAQKIQDPNLLVKFIKLEIFTSKTYGVDQKIVPMLMNFLQQHYNDKQILRLFSEVNIGNINDSYLIDMLHEFKYSFDHLDEMFVKPKCTLRALHDEFSRISRFYLHKEIFSRKLTYSKFEIEQCRELENYKVMLPLTGRELLEWADSLNNCMAGYFSQLEKKETTIYGFFEFGEIAFAVEIFNGEIMQASGKYNAELTVEQKKVLKQWDEIRSVKEKTVGSSI